jgi:hypothetical protein
VDVSVVNEYRQVLRKPSYCDFAADVSVSLESAAETLAEAAEAFCVESRLAAAAAEDDKDSVNGSGTVTKAELLAQSKPFDPAPALAVVKVRECDIQLRFPPLVIVARLRILTPNASCCYVHCSLPPPPPSRPAASFRSRRR